MSSSVCDWISKLCALWNSIHINLSEAFGEMQICSSFFNVDKKIPSSINRSANTAIYCEKYFSKQEEIYLRVCLLLAPPAFSGLRFPLLVYSTPFPRGLVSRLSMLSLASIARIHSEDSDKVPRTIRFHSAKCL